MKDKKTHRGSRLALKLQLSLELSNGNYHPAAIKRSVFGLIRIYNSLPDHIVSAKIPQILQRGLQKLAKEAALANVADWPLIFHARGIQ